MNPMTPIRLVRSWWILGKKTTRILRRNLCHADAETEIRRILPRDGALPSQLPVMAREGNLFMAAVVIVRHIEVLRDKGRHDDVEHFAEYRFGSGRRTAIDAVKERMGK